MLNYMYNEYNPNRDKNKTKIAFGKITHFNTGRFKGSKVHFPQNSTGRNSLNLNFEHCVTELISKSLI